MLKLAKITKRTSTKSKKSSNRRAWIKKKREEIEELKRYNEDTIK